MNLAYQEDDLEEAVEDLEDEVAHPLPEPLRNFPFAATATTAVSVGRAPPSPLAALHVAW